MKCLALSLVLLVSTLAAQVSRADDKFEPFGYLTVGGSYGRNLMDGTFDDAWGGVFSANAHTTIGDTWGANAHLGYRFNKFLAVEGEYEWMKDFHIRVDGVAIGKMQTQVATANLKVVAPYGMVEPWFSAGFGMIFTTVDKTVPVDWDVATGVFTTKFGAGVDFWLSKNFVLTTGATVVANAAKVTGPGFAGGRGGEGVNYMAAQLGFGWRF